MTRRSFVKVAGGALIAGCIPACSGAHQNPDGSVGADASVGADSGTDAHVGSRADSGPTSAPDWFLALTPFQWTAIGHSLNSDDPNGAPPLPGGTVGTTTALFVPWCGFTVDQFRKSMVSCVAMGHSNGTYVGVVEFNLGLANPRWRVIDPDAADHTNVRGILTADNSVGADHTYNWRLWCPLDRKIYGFRGGDTSGSYHDLLWSYDREHRTTASSRGFDVTTYGYASWSTGSHGSDGGSDYDPVTKKLLAIPRHYAADSGGALILDPISETVTFAGDANPGPSDYITARCAGNKGLLAALSKDSGATLKGWDTTDMAAGHQVNVTVDGGPVLDSAPDFVWHEASDAFLVRGGSDVNIYLLKPDNGWANWKTSTWSFTKATNLAAGPASLIANYSNGSYGKFHIVPDMGNGEACLVYIPTEDAQPMVMRLSGAIT